MTIRLTTAPFNEGIWLPSDNGLVAWSGWLPSASTATVNGTLYLIGLQVRKPVASGTRKGTVHVATAAIGPVASQNWMALIDSTGTTLGSAADIGTASTSSGPLTATLGTFGLTVQMYWLAVLLNAATPAALGRPSSVTAIASLGNLNLTAATARWATAGTGLTAMPSSITPSANSTASSTPTYCGGLS